MPQKKHIKLFRILALMLPLSILLALGANWDRLMLKYQLAIVRREPSLFEEYLLSEHEVFREAARLFLEEPGGKQQLFDMYLREFESTTYESNTLFHFRGQGARQRKLSGGFLILKPTSYVMQSRWGGTRGHNEASMAMAPANSARRDKVIDLISLLEGEIFESEMLPGYQFQIQDLRKSLKPAWPRDRRAMFPKAEVASVPRRHMGCTCFFRAVVPLATARKAS